MTRTGEEDEGGGRRDEDEDEDDEENDEEGQRVRRHTLTLAQLSRPDPHSYLAGTLFKLPLAGTHFRPPTPSMS